MFNDVYYMCYPQAKAPIRFVNQNRDFFKFNMWLFHQMLVNKFPIICGMV